MVNGYDHPRYGKQPALCRRVVNSRIQRLTQCYKWAVGEELVAVEVFQALKAVPGLKKHRTEARESEPVKPVPIEAVEVVLPLLTLRLAGAVRFQRFTGASRRSAAVRLAEIDRGGPVWLYKPQQHKTAYRDRDRTIAIGPKGQDVLRDYIKVKCPLCGVEGRPPRLAMRCIPSPVENRLRHRSKVNLLAA